MLSSSVHSPFALDLLAAAVLNWAQKRREGRTCAACLKTDTQTSGPGCLSRVASTQRQKHVGCINLHLFFYLARGCDKTSSRQYGFTLAQQPTSLWRRRIKLCLHHDEVETYRITVCIPFQHLFCIPFRHEYSLPNTSRRL